MDIIAVVMNLYGHADSFFKESHISVYKKQVRGWLTVNEIPAQIDFSKDIFLVREELSDLITQLGDCKIIVGRTISGLAYQMFDKKGFHIFEVEQFTPAILDKILSDVDRETISDGNAACPVETDVPGVYFLDLITLQNQNPEISSKMILQPFLTNIPFLQLNIVCGHLPPWMESFIAKKGMKMIAEEPLNGKVYVHITKTYC